MLFRLHKIKVFILDSSKKIDVGTSKGAVCLFLFCLACGSVSKNINRQQLIMGTFVTVELPDAGQTEVVFRIFRKYHNMWSTYKPNSELSRINKRELTHLSSDSLDVLRKSQRVFKKTHGFFSVAQGAGLLGGRQGFVLNANKIKLSKGIKLDLGGIGKGYALDKAVHKLRENNVQQGQVAASGDIACLSTCTLSLQHPFRESVFATLKGSKQGLRVSTSGSYRNFKGTSKRHHIKNPYTNKSSQGLSSLSLFSLSNSAGLDAMATGVFAMNNFKKILDLLDGQKQLSYILVTQQGGVYIGKRIYEIVKGISWSDLRDLKIKTKTPTKNN